VTLEVKTLFLWLWGLQGEWSTCFKATMKLRKLGVCLDASGNMSFPKLVLLIGFVGI
jgi:hypothetical protein